MRCLPHVAGNGFLAAAACVCPAPDSVTGALFRNEAGRSARAVPWAEASGSCCRGGAGSPPPPRKSFCSYLAPAGKMWDRAAGRPKWPRRRQRRVCRTFPWRRGCSRTSGTSVTSAAAPKGATFPAASAASGSCSASPKEAPFLSGSKSRPSSAIFPVAPHFFFSSPFPCSLYAALFRLT